MYISVLIPTFKRASLLSYVLEGLKKQTFKDFEVVIVLKPSDNDETESVIEKFKKWLEIELVLQNSGYVVDALNLGLKRVKGDIIAFLDDDAVPCIEWAQRHIESYKKRDVGGVAGNVIPAKFEGSKIIEIKGASHIIPNFRFLSYLENIFHKVWSQPLEGMENYLVYLSKAGVVKYNSNLSRIAWRQPVESLLGMGANMSVLRKAIKDFKFPNSWILGLAWEQFLGWYLWKKGYFLIFNPKASVYHLIHGQTLTRSIRNYRRALLRCIEHNLLFYRLYGSEPSLSLLYRITWLIFSSLINLKKFVIDKDHQQIANLKGKFYSEMIGLKWLLSKKIGDGTYRPLLDLQKLNR